MGDFTDLKQIAKLSLMILDDIFNCCMKFSLSVCQSVLKEWLGKPAESNSRHDFVSGIVYYAILEEQLNLFLNTNVSTKTNITQTQNFPKNFIITYRPPN